jgi:hypothetical protein
MAIAFEITYTVQDDSGDTATAAIHIPNTFSLSQYTEFGRAMADLVDNMVHGLLLSADLTITLDISALTGNAVTPFADVEEIGAYLFVTGENRPVSVNLPGIAESHVLAGSDDIDQLQSAEAAFITAMVTGIAVTGGTVAPCDVNEADITDIVYAREQFRSSGKRR